MTSMSKKADLFDKAIVDLWLAESAVNYRADATINSCSQCVEKMIKGTLKCYDLDYDFTHNISDLYERILDAKEIINTKDFSKEIALIGVWGNSIRYKNMKDDPNINDGKKILRLTNEIVISLASLAKVEPFYREAKEYNDRIYKASLEKKNSDEIE